ncbi:MAG: hypothetical protein AB1896_14255, partial [Thermodesulfobacteriota bacterium]
MAGNQVSLDQWVAQEADKARGRDRQLYMFFQKEWSEGHQVNPLLFPFSEEAEFWHEQFDWYVTVENFETPKEETKTVRFPEVAKKRPAPRVSAPVEEPTETVILDAGDLGTGTEAAVGDEANLETVILDVDNLAAGTETAAEEPHMATVILDAAADIETVSLAEKAEPRPAVAPGPEDAVRLDQEEPAGETVGGPEEIDTVNLADHLPSPPEPEHPLPPVDDGATVTFVQAPGDGTYEDTFIMESVPVAKYETAGEEKPAAAPAPTPAATPARSVAEELGFEPVAEEDELSELETLIAEDGLVSDPNLEIKAAPAERPTLKPPAGAKKPAAPAERPTLKPPAGAKKPAAPVPQQPLGDLDDLDTLIAEYSGPASGGPGREPAYEVEPGGSGLDHIDVSAFEEAASEAGEALAEGTVVMDRSGTAPEEAGPPKV